MCPPNDKGQTLWACPNIPAPERPNYFLTSLSQTLAAPATSMAALPSSMC